MNSLTTYLPLLLLLLTSPSASFLPPSSPFPQSTSLQSSTSSSPSFSSIKNVRDLSSTSNPIKPNIIYRTGMPSNANSEDIKQWSDLGIKTLIDLRSKTELEADEGLESCEVYEGFVDVKYSSVRSPREIETKEKVKKVEHREDRKERHFVSLMDERKYVVGTIKALQKRKLAKVAALSPGVIVSKRVRKKAKKVFLDRINSGGLGMVNDLILEWGSGGIKYVLEIMSDETRHPVAFYCTAGKDRTGVLAAVILKLCGAEGEEIVNDYAISAKVYEEMNDDSAMVGALKQRDLDPETFLGAPREVMEATLERIEEMGGIEAYLDRIKFGAEGREKLKNAIMQ